MNIKEKIPWTQLAVEAVAIVVSILFAFWIDATWDRHQRQTEGHQLATALTLDIEATQTHIDSLVDRSTRTKNLAKDILQGLADPSRRDHLPALLLNTGSVFVYHIWHPTTDTYDQALGSGDLSLIDDLDLRSALAKHATELASLGTFYDSAELQYFDTLEPFLVKNTVYSELAASWNQDNLIGAPYSTDFQYLIESREFWNLLTLKLEMEDTILGRLVSASHSNESLHFQLAHYIDR